jgi:uncharacterized Ntn-hydrolase superfamily protein
MIRGIFIFFIAVIPASAGQSQFPRKVSTFSIVACDPDTGQMGIAVASRYFAVGSVVPWAMAGVGAAATQADVNVGYGPKAIDLLRQGLSASQVSDRLLAEDNFPGKEGRQFAITDSNCNVVTHTGPKAPNWAGGKTGKNWAAQGNILVGPQVPEAMGKAFESTEGELAERMFAALAAGDSVGGDKRGRQSAAMLIVCGKQNMECGRNYNNPRWLYINVDDNPNPFPELRRLLDEALANNYGDLAYKLFEQHKLTDAKATAEKALHYAPNDSDNHLTLGFVDYVSGDKDGAVVELKKARQMDPKFTQNFEATIKGEKALAPMLQDRQFLENVFPEGVPAALRHP